MSVQDLDKRFSFLDQLPDTLFETVVTTRHGSLPQRAEGVMVWRRLLLSGRLPRPEELPWPEPSITQVLLPRLDVLELAPLCTGEESLVDHLLKDICRAVDSVDEWRERDMEGLFDDRLDQHRRERNTPSELPPQLDDTKAPPDTLQEREPEAGEDGDDSGGAEGSDGAGTADRDTPPAPRAHDSDSGEVEVPSADGQQDALTGALQPMHELTHAEISAPADDGGDAPGEAPPSHADELAGSLELDWRELAEQWRETDEVVKGMATRLGRGWDLSQGILASEGWRTFMRLRHWLKGHPELCTIVEQMGRDYEGQGDGTVTDVRMTEEAESLQMSKLPLEVIRSESPMSTQGIVRSDDIARMLPQEAAYLGHPQLHMLWHARRAEQALLSYQVEGVLSEHQPELDRVQECTERKRQQSERRRGPLMVCIDTSASMHGEPEQLAKAICLEVLRLANSERRECLLFAFSGPGQLLEKSLDFSQTGLKSIIRFLQQTFHGGTDISEPVNLALERVKEERWRKADMLLVSDGRFQVPAALVHRLQAERKNGGLRVQGISVGRWSNQGMGQMCESIFRFESSLSGARRSS